MEKEDLDDFITAVVADDSAAASTGSGSASGKGGKGKGKERRRGATQYCKVCDKWLPPSDFQVGQAVCHEDKKILDCIYRLASRQQQKEWFHEHRMDEKKCKAMVDNYKKVSKDYELSLGKKPKWTLSMYQETLKAVSMV